MGFDFPGFIVLCCVGLGFLVITIGIDADGYKAMLNHEILNDSQVTRMAINISVLFIVMFCLINSNVRNGINKIIKTSMDGANKMVEKMLKG